MKFLRVAAVSMTTILAACANENAVPPDAPQRPERLERHGDVRIDNYLWLNDRDDPDVIAYLEAENAYADRALRGTAGLQQKLVEEMASRIKPDEKSVPYLEAGYYYYYRYAEGNEYPVYCRRKGSLAAPEQVLLDVNAAADGKEYFAVRGFSVSPDQRKAVYGVDTVGRRLYTLHFLDLETGQTLPDTIEDVTANAEWANDSRTVFYTQQDPETLRWYRVYRHELGTSQHELVYQEDDASNSLYLEKSLSGRFIYLTSAETVSTEIRYLPADEPHAVPRLFLPRERGHEYYVTDGLDRFYILSNDDAINFRVFESPLDATAREDWRVVVPHRDDVLIEGLDVFRDYLVVSSLRDGLTRIEVMSRKDGDLQELEFSEQVYSAYTDDNYVYATSVLRYVYESMTTPESTYDYDLHGHAHRLVHQEEVPGGFDRGNYRTERILAPARDGTRVPVSLVYRNGMQKDGNRPLLQYGYGAYGATIDPDFDPDLLSLLDRGFIFAIAHVRGGSLLGREWYFQGRQLSKMNTFNDFIDVSKYLISQRYTSPGHLYARGGSAGGLLMGAVANLAPELYHGISAAVPFVDVVTTMLDESIPLTTGEFDEWGNPAERKYYEYIRSYSPYDNVGRHAYPNMLITASLHDSQVQYWEPAKWVAKLRDMKTDDNLLLLKTDMAAGHGGKSGRFNSLEDTALYYAFLLSLEGIRE